MRKNIQLKKKRTSERKKKGNGNGNIKPQFKEKMEWIKKKKKNKEIQYIEKKVCVKAKKKKQKKKTKYNIKKKFRREKEIRKEDYLCILMETFCPVSGARICLAINMKIVAHIYPHRQKDDDVSCRLIFLNTYRFTKSKGRAQIDKQKEKKENKVNKKASLMFVSSE